MFTFVYVCEGEACLCLIFTIAWLLGAYFLPLNPRNQSPIIRPNHVLIHIVLVEYASRPRLYFGGSESDLVYLHTALTC